jgi:hypothetical protein
MRIRQGWQAAAPAAGQEDVEPVRARRIRQGPEATVHLVAATEMTLPQPDLSGDRIGETRVLFQQFLDHLDRLGLAEPATHVSLGFERFLAMYPAEPSEG